MIDLGIFNTKSLTWSTSKTLGEKTKEESEKKMRFWRRSLFGFIDLLRIWNITISSIIYPCCLVSKQRPWERLLGFVDKTSKKMRTVFEIIEPNISSLHRVNTQSLYYSTSITLQQEQLQAPISSTFCSFGLCLAFFCKWRPDLTMVSVDSSIDLISLVILVKRR